MTNRAKKLVAHTKNKQNTLTEELSTQALAEFDSEVRFRALAARGDAQRGLEILDILDQHFSAEPQAV